MDRYKCTILVSCIFVIAVTTTYIVLYYNLLVRHRTIKKVAMCDTGIADINIYPELPNRSIYDSYTWKEVMNKSMRWNKTQDIPEYVLHKYPLAVDMVELVKDYKESKGNIPYEVINPYPYNYTQKPTILPCGDFSEDSYKYIYLLFLIKSHFNHSNRRQAIRRTWTDVSNITDYCVRHVFLIGGIPSKDKKHKMLINAESKSYRDLLRMDFIENYYHNTLKTRGGLKWAAEFCPGAKYVMLVDDDYYVATDLLIQQLEESNLPDKLYMGWSFIRPKPFRHKSSRWYITFKDFPYNMYPNFHAAGAIVMSMELVQDIVIASQFTKHFVFDDIYLALITSKLNVTLVTNELLRNNVMPYIETKFWKTIASHDYWNPNDLHLAWKCHLHYKYTSLEDTLFIQGS